MKIMISQEDVKNIAKLARLGITNNEAEKFQKDLSAILDFIEKLKEVNVDNVEATTNVTGLENKTRQDQGEKKEEKTRKNILANAPETKDGYVKVKAILE